MDFTMKTFLLFFLASSFVAIQAQKVNRGTYTYEFRSGNRRINDHNSKAPINQQYYNGKTEKPHPKASSGVPPYAVLMEPLVHYSQPDPLYVQEKQNLSVVPYETRNDLIKKKYVTDDSKDSKTAETFVSAKAGTPAPYEDSMTSAAHAKWISAQHVIHARPYRRKPKPRPTYAPPPPPTEPPEPIIEIIIKESNISLPGPPPPPPPPKKKKEPVQVFFVKYSKDPHAEYGEEKLIYEAPIPAVTPPTNNEDPNEEIVEEAPYPEAVTYGPPPPSTTLKAIIKPDSEVYHGTGGLQITFGGPEHHDEDAGGFHNGGGGGGGYGPPPEIGGGGDGYGPPPAIGGGGGYHDADSAPYPSSHHGDYHEHSASEIAATAAYPRKSAGISRASTDAQPSKRNPEPFSPSTPSPQQSLHNTARPTHSAFVSPQEFRRPTPLPTFQQAPQFPAQTFQKPPQSFNTHHHHQHHRHTQPTVNIPRQPQPTQTYSTLPQSLFQNPAGHHHFGASRSPPVQTAQPSQQYHTINDAHLRQSFQSNVRPTPPQQYHTINQQTLQTSNYRTLPSSTNVFPPQPTSATPSHSFVQRNQPLQQQAQTHQLHQHQQHQIQQHQQQHQIQQPQQLSVQQHQQLQAQQLQAQQHQALQQQVLQHRPFQNRPQVNVLEQYRQQQQARFQEFQQQQQQQQGQPQFHQFQSQPQQNHQIRQQQPIQQHQQFQQLQQQPQQQRPQPQAKPPHSDSEPEVIKSISPDISSLTNPHAQTQKPSFPPQQRPTFQQPKPVPQVAPAPRPAFQPQQHSFQTSKPAFLPTVSPAIQFSTSRPQFQQTTRAAPTYRTTAQTRTYTQTTEQPIEYVTEDPKKLEEERRKKEERRKQNVAALPKEVPEDLRQQLLSSGILGNADIQILDYDKIGDIPIESLPPEALANFQQVAAGSEPRPSVVRPDKDVADTVPSASDNQESIVSSGRNSGDLMEMKVVRFNPDSKEGANVANNYMREGATQLDPVVLNDSKYNRYLPLKVAGAQFPVPDVPELRGRNVTSVVVLAPVDYEFLQRKEEYPDSISRSAGPVLEVQGVHFIAGDTLKNLVKVPTTENYKRWLEKENSTSVDKQSVVLLVLEPLSNSPSETKDIFMFDIGTQRVSKLKGELSSTFVEVAESNSQNEDLEEISDSPSAPGGDFTITDTSGIPPSLRRTQRKVKSGSPKAKAKAT